MIYHIVHTYIQIYTCTEKRRRESYSRCLEQMKTISADPDWEPFCASCTRTVFPFDLICIVTLLSRKILILLIITGAIVI